MPAVSGFTQRSLTTFVADEAKGNPAQPAHLSVRNMSPCDAAGSLTQPGDGSELWEQLRALQALFTSFMEVIISQMAGCAHGGFSPNPCDRTCGGCSPASLVLASLSQPPCSNVPATLAANIKFPAANVWQKSMQCFPIVLRHSLAPAPSCRLPLIAPAGALSQASRPTWA